MPPAKLYQLQGPQNWDPSSLGHRPNGLPHSQLPPHTHIPKRLTCPPPRPTRSQTWRRDKIHQKKGAIFVSEDMQQAHWRGWKWGRLGEKSLLILDALWLCWREGKEQALASPPACGLGWSSGRKWSPAQGAYSLCTSHPQIWCSADQTFKLT